MGTPAFGVPTLRALAASRHRIAACYTRAPSASGRGRRITRSAIHDEADRLGIPVATPSTLRTSDALPDLLAHEPDVVVVAAYGLILPRAIIDAPRLGCINVHGSLLPRWRGAAPVQRAILAGDMETGVSIMRMDAGVDTGPVMLSDTFDPGRDCAGAVMARMAEMGARMTLAALDDPDAHPPVPQPTTGATHAAKIDKAEARIDFAQDAARIDRLVRALNPAPGAWTTIMGERVAIHACDPVEGSGRPGDLLDDELTIACGEGAIRVTLAQRAGRRPATGRDIAAWARAVGAARCE